MLSREFGLNDVLLLWDAIFANIPKDSLMILSDPAYNPLSESTYTRPEADPLFFLELLVLAMIKLVGDECKR